MFFVLFASFVVQKKCKVNKDMQNKKVPDDPRYSAITEMAMGRHL